MRGIVLSGGLGSRLYPLTHVTNKHLLPIYNKPMIFYPIETLVRAGIKEILVIVSGPHAGHFLPILKNGQDFGLNKIEYAVQDKADGGIGDALSLAENFANGEDICVILGDNTMDVDITDHIRNFKSGAKIFLKEVADPSEFGVPRFDDKNKIIEIIEKPEQPPSNYAVIGLYLYDQNVFDIIRKCTPSDRNQLEITSCNNLYLSEGKLDYAILENFWIDAGTHDNLYLANKYWYEKSKK